MRIQVYACKRMLPIFELLEQLQPVKIHFTDWSLSPQKLLKNIIEMAKADVIYFHSSTNLRVLMIPIAKIIMHKPVMLNWIGTDVLTVSWNHLSFFHDIGLEKKISVQKTLTSGLPRFTKIVVSLTMKNIEMFVVFLKKFVTHHVAVAPHLTQNLKQLNISANNLPLLCHIKYELLPFPNDFAVMSYVGYHPSSDESAFYGWNSLIRIAKDYPDLTIFVVGRKSSLGDHPSNMVFLGYVNDIRQVLSKVKAVIRLTYHDGMPRLILEGLATGRYIIYAQSFPHTFHVQDYKEVKKALETIREESNPNLSGFNYVKQEYDPQKVAQQFIKEFEYTKYAIK